MVIVPVETICGFETIGWEVCDEIAFSSGVLDIMVDARLISCCLGGAEADFRGGDTRCASTALAAPYAFGLFNSTDCL